MLKANKTTKKCPNCSGAVVGHPNKKFCNPKCKDRYHNIFNPRGYGAPNRKDDYTYEDYLDELHPFSSEALGQWDD